MEPLDTQFGGPDRLLGQSDQADALLVQGERLLQFDLPPFEGPGDLLQAVERLLEGLTVVIILPPGGGEAISDTRTICDDTRNEPS
jgi:hypothetical protein